MLNSETVVTSKIDWLAVTAANVDYHKSWSNDREEMRHGLQSYDTGVKYLDGRIELCSSNRKDMHPHIIFSGSTIDRICNHAEQTSFDINRHMSYGRASRIDLAVDVKYGYLDIQALDGDFRRLKVTTRAEEGLYYAGSRKRGETLYIGSPNAHRQLKVYDKAAERGVNYEWTRVELRLRGRAAAKTSAYLATVKSPEKELPKLILDYADFIDNRDWRIVMGETSVKIGITSVAKTDREKWLLETVSKSVANEMISNMSGKDFLKTFTSSVLREYATKKSKVLTTVPKSDKL